MKRMGLVGLVLLGSALAQPFTLSSPAFKPGDPLPKASSCGGASPPLVFANLPKGTQSLAVLGWDESRTGLKTTWVVYDLPASTQSLDRGVKIGPPGKQGKNSQNKQSYSLECPVATGTSHRYYFDLYAIKVSSLGLPAGASLEAVHKAIQKYRIQEAKLMAGMPK